MNTIAQPKKSVGNSRLDCETAIMDGNEAASYIYYKTSEVCAIYPITPSSPMREWAAMIILKPFQ
ncbi:MAG: hypothetical protein C4308_01825 [Chitinophagaceae bacterium]